MGLVWFALAPAVWYLPVLIPVWIYSLMHGFGLVSPCLELDGLTLFSGYLPTFGHAFVHLYGSMRDHSLMGWVWYI
jgi:hypothetical protein